MTTNPSTMLDGLLTVQPENNGVDVGPRRVWSFSPSTGLSFTDNPTIQNPDGTFGRLDVTGSGGGTGTFDLVVPCNNSGATLASTTQNITVQVKGLTGDVTITMPPGVDGQRVTVVDVDGSLAAHNIILNGGGANIVRAGVSASSLTMTNGTFGAGGAVTVVFGDIFDIWSAV